MQVKFKGTAKNDTEYHLIDSSKIYASGNWINVLNGRTLCCVDDPTLAYLQNAWAHKGMRRVLYSAPVPNIPNDTVVREIIHNHKGWYFEKDVYDNIGKLVGKAKHLNIRFIDYEMEEQK